jgi:O-antigen ligase
MTAATRLRPGRHAALASIGGPAIIIAFAVLALVVANKAFYNLLSESGDFGPVQSRKASNHPLYVLQWLLLAVSTLVLFLRLVLQQRLAPSLLFAAPMVLLVLASATWAIEPRIVLYHASVFTLLVLAAYVLAEHLSPRRFLTILAITVAAQMLGSLLLYATVPTLVAHPRWGGGWITEDELAGMFGHKNEAGNMMAVLLVLTVHGAFLGWRPAMRWVIGGLAVLTLLLTNSATGVISAAMGVAFVAIVRYCKGWENALVYGAAPLLVLFVSVYPFTGLTGGVALLGRDPNLTGRIDIWSSAFEFISERPLLGYGYYGFFSTDPFSPAWRLWERSEWFLTPHFHNSVVEIMMSIGLLGLLLFYGVLAVGLAVNSNRTIDPRIRLLAAVVLLQITLDSFQSLSLMVFNGFGTLYLYYCLFAAQRSYTEKEA